MDSVQAIAGLISDSAEYADRERQLPEELLNALHQARLFRLLLPCEFNGEEISPPEFFETIEAVAKLDASTAWCLCQANGCAMTAAYLAPQVASEIWANDPEAVLAWGPPTAKSTATIDASAAGYRLNGQWSFASGCRHASWLGAQCNVLEADATPRYDEDGAAVIRTFLIPKSQAEMIDIWQVMGLRGTGSDGFRLQNHAISHEYSVARDEPGERRYHSPLYLFPAMSLYASGFSGVALGIARSMLDAFKELASAKKPRLARHVLRDNHVIQFEVAQSEVRLNAARTFLLHELNDIWSDTVATQQLTVEQRMRIRLATTHAIHEAKQVADTVYDIAGATAIFQSSAFERRFRDLHTVTQQLQGRKTHYQTVGAFLLGLPADLSVI